MYYLNPTIFGARRVLSPPWRWRSLLLVVFVCSIWTVPGAAQNGNCPSTGLFTSYFSFSGTVANPTLQILGANHNVFDENNTSIWAHPDNLTPVSDWYSIVKWKYDDNDGAFQGLYDDESTDSPKLPLYDSDLLTYVGNQGQKDVVYTGYLPIGPGKTWCFQPFADINGEIDDGTEGKFVRLKTAPAYPPTNVQIGTNGIGFTRVAISWQKGTHAPDTKHEYIVSAETQGGSVVQKDTIAGSLRSYTFTDLQDGTAYTFKVQTYIKASTLSFQLGSLSWNNYSTYSASTSSAATDQATTQDFTFTITQGDYPTKVRLSWSPIAGNEGSSIRVERNKVNPRSNIAPDLNDFEERNILSTAATSYEDIDAIPGLVYNYRLSVLDINNNTISSFVATGWRRPNGVIRGKIQTSNNIGVSGVRVCAKPKNPIQVPGALSLPDPDSDYCVNTTISGRFEIRNIYYFDSATFVITPYLTDHSFDPGSDEAILDLSTPVQSGFTFIDTTAYGLRGKVYFPLANTFGGTGLDTIPVEGVSILVDTTDYGIRTDANGIWNYAVLDTGTYKFRPSFLDHTFDQSVLTAQVLRDRNDLNFVDQTVDSVLVRAQDGCGDPVADSVLVKVSYDQPGGDSFFEKTIKTNPQGIAQVTLPATKFQFAVTANNPALDAVTTDPNIKPQFLGTPVKLDLTYRDSVRSIRVDSMVNIRPSFTDTVNGSPITIPADTTLIIQEDSIWRKPQPSANFLYYGPIKISINWEEVGAKIVRGCTTTGPATANDSVIILQSGASYRLTISVIDSVKNCPVDTGNLVIFDFVSERENSPISLPISKGKVMYEVNTGAPNTSDGGSNPYQKAFYMQVAAGSRPVEGRANWILVEGAEDITPTFTTRSPSLPDFVVHDPPGDASYAWIEKGSYKEVSQKVQFLALEDGNGKWVDATIGGSKEIEVPGTPGSIKGGITIERSSETGSEGSFTKLANYVYEFGETFSTSAEPFWTGHDGDVYIGKATNQRFSVAKVLLYDEASCQAEIQDKPNLELTGIATTFQYTEKHIKRVLLPQLEFLELTLRREASRETDVDRKEGLIRQADSFKIDQANWQGILAQNARDRDSAATFVENISFSAGASFERVVSVSQDTTIEQEYFEFREAEFGLGAAFELEYYVWFEAHGGGYGRSRVVTMPSDERDRNRDSTGGTSMTMGFAFDDTNFGDYFSVDVLKDPKGIPAFRTFAGASSCPHEPGTQARDKAQISVFPPRIDNADPEEGATFSITLTNKSESRETRDYYVRAHPQNNPHGAVITLGGFEIMTDQMQFSLDSLALELPLVIEKGPRSNNYENIAISIIPQCEWDAFQNNGDVTGGDTVFLSVTFESECSSVAIVEPDNNWFINNQTGNTLVVDLGGYDANNENLESLTLQYRYQGEEWVDGQTVLVGDLVDDLYRMSIDFTNLPNGNYWLRAKATCSAGGDIVFSPEVSGVVQKGSMAPFGVPSPGDGFLRIGQELFVQFDQPMDTAISNRVNYPSPPQITLIQSDNLSEVPFTIRWSNDSSILFFDIDPAYRNDVSNNNTTLQATVKGLRSGITPNFEPQTVAVDWTVLLNVSPVSWAPNRIVEKVFAGQNMVLNARLQSATGVPKDFQIVRLPSWLTVASDQGRVLPYDKQVVQLLVSPEIGVGIFEDTVVANIDGIPEYLVVKIISEARRPNWVVNPSDFVYSMNMVVAMSLDQSNTNLSRDDRDMIAAVYNGEVRGVARLEYVEQFNKYMAFLTVYSNIPANEEISFNMWRAATGITHQAEETFFFASEQVYGRIGAPEVLHPGPLFQGIPLKQGWNWVSLNTQNTNTTINYLLSSLTSPKIGNDVTVKRKDGQTATFTQFTTPFIFSNQWAGNLRALNNEQAYLIHLSNADDTLYIPGNPITNFSNINLFSGWNWIGYQSQSAKPVNEALASVNLRNRDLLKSQEAFSEYHKGSDTWYGPLQFMEPGHGYKLKLKDGVPYRDLVYTRLGLKDFEVDHTVFESNMTLIGSLGYLDLGSQELDPERLIVGAFIGDSCRGYGYVEYVKFLDDYRTVFSFHGNAQDIGKEVSFKLYDTQSGQEFISPEDMEIYVSDRILGSMLEPFELFSHLELPQKGYFLEQNYPNPYDTKTSIRFILPETAHVKLSIYDQFGKLIQVLSDEEKAAGEHTLIFDAKRLPTGTYHYSIEAGSFRASRKMVKM